MQFLLIFKKLKREVMRKKIHVSTGAVIATANSTIRYIADTRRSTNLSRAEELDLATRAQAGDQAARNQLIEANLRFVIQVARSYQGMGLLLEDLIAFGNVGLIEAVNRFDTTRGVKFTTAAVWYIRAEIQKALNDLSRVVRIPSHKTATESQHVKSIHTPVGDDENKETYADRYLEADSTKSAQDTRDLRFDLQRALSQLKPKQREAVERFYGIGLEYPQCMDQIAEEMQITGERARQLVRQAETELRRLPGIELLEQYC
jgi:RNA polymerase primary sigma factor